MSGTDFGGTSLGMHWESAEQADIETVSHKVKTKIDDVMFLSAYLREGILCTLPN